MPAEVYRWAGSIRDDGIRVFRFAFRSLTACHRGGVTIVSDTRDSVRGGPVTGREMMDGTLYQEAHA